METLSLRETLAIIQNLGLTWQWKKGHDSNHQGTTKVCWWPVEHRNFCHCVQQPGKTFDNFFGYTTVGTNGFNQNISNLLWLRWKYVYNLFACSLLLYWHQKYLITFFWSFIKKLQDIANLEVKEAAHDNPGYATAQCLNFPTQWDIYKLDFLYTKS